MIDRIIVPLFKVLVDGKPCHGGSGEYPTAGLWTEKITPSCCHKGWHLTSDPLRWWRPQATLWLAEGRGMIDGDCDDKAAFEQVRLLKQIEREWGLLLMFPRLRAFLAASERSLDEQADITWAYLSGANLSWANLSGANLSWASLSWAHLSGAHLSGANLSWANLSGANLSRAKLPRAYPPKGWAVDSYGYLYMDKAK